MGKKRKIISKPKKFNKKHANHPLAKVALKPEEVKEVAAEPKPEIKKPEPVAVVKESKPETKKVEVDKAPPQRRKRKTPVATKKTKPSDD